MSKILLCVRTVYTPKHDSFCPQHVPIPARTTHCRKERCTVKWYSLETSWATTIHKFQEFEASFDNNDMFWQLTVDPRDTSWEQTCPGALYVALSRAKTMGPFETDALFPSDSATYWQGCNVSVTQIREGSMKNGNRVLQKWNVN